MVFQSYFYEFRIITSFIFAQQYILPYWLFYLLFQHISINEYFLHLLNFQDVIVSLRIIVNLLNSCQTRPNLVKFCRLRDYLKGLSNAARSN